VKAKGFYVLLNNEADRTLSFTPCWCWKSYLMLC